jgi:hypothetical protein
MFDPAGPRMTLSEMPIQLSRASRSFIANFRELDYRLPHNGSRLSTPRIDTKCSYLSRKAPDAPASIYLYLNGAESFPLARKNKQASANMQKRLMEKLRRSLNIQEKYINVKRR